MKKILLFAVILICGGLGATAQLVNGNAFLQGQYIEVGINQCGSWGTTNDAPAGYHARSGVSGISTTTGNSLQNLGFVADPDKDGWTVGSPNKYNGDYFMPYASYCGWGISFGTYNYGNDRDKSNKNNCGSLYGTGTTAFPGTMQSVTNSNGIMQALWQGTNNGMQVQKIVSVKSSKLYFTVQIKLKNTSASAISNVYYGDYVNQDNDAYYQDLNSGNLNTKDTIVFQNPTDGKTLVKGIGSTTQSYIALGSKDCRSKVGRANTVPQGAVAGWYNGTAASSVTLSGGAGSANNAICISFSLGTLAAGDSTSFSYTYILKENDFDEALAATDPGFTSNGVSYQSGDTILNCAAAPLNLSITNGEYYNWTWSPATGLNTTTGLNVTANPASTTTYIATGISSCATKYDTITVVPLSRLYVDGSIAASGSGNSWASPMKTVSQALNFANTTCVNEIWVKSGTYYPMLGLTTVATSRDSSFRILRNGIKLYGGFAGTETALAQRNIAANVTTLSGDIGVANDSTDNAHHVVTILAPAATTLDTSTILSGFTIRGGNSNINTGFTYNGLPVIRNDGGGILCAANSNGSAANALVDSCTIVFNYANVGGGMYSGGYTGGTSSPTVRNCLFTQNSAGDVAGLHSFSADSGALSSATVANCRFIANRAVAGGAMGTLNRNGSVTNPTVLNCVFSGNTASSEGGAVNIYSGMFTATNCVFAGNTSPSGSVIKIPSGSTVSFRNSTLYNSSGSTSAAVVSAGTLNLNNTILWGVNATEIANTGSINASYSDIRGVAAAGTSISVNPQFVNPANPIGADNIWGTSDDGLRLTPCSPAINAGSNTLVPAGITTDIANTTRIQNTTVEMGAYEMPYNSTGLPSTTIAMSPANPVCSNTAVLFTATTVAPGSIPAYQWYKNGVAVGTNQATYTFNNWNTNDSVWVVHTNNDCNLSDTSNKRYIQANPLPVITAATPANPTACGGTNGSLSLSGNFVTGTSYTVNYSKNGVAQTAAVLSGNAGTVTLTGLSAGSYTAFTVTALACTSVAFAGPVVLSDPSAPSAPVASSNSPLCANATLNLNATTVAGATYNWTGPNGFTATVQNPSVTNIQTNGAGTYSVTANVAGCVSVPGTTVVVVNTVPASSGTITGSAAPCANTSQTYSVSPVTGATTYTWTLPNGWTGTSTTASITVTTSASSGTVSVVANNQCGASVTPATLAVTPVSIPVTPVSITGPAAPCANTSQTYSVSPVTGATTYTWTLPNGWTGTSTTASITVTTSATAGNISVTAGNTCGASTAQTLAVMPVSVPVMPGTITGPAAPCANTSQMYSVAPVTGATTYTWTLPNGWTGTSTTASITVTTSATSGTVSVTAGNTCGTSANRTLSVVPVNIPVNPGSITGPSAPCANTSQTYSVAPVTGATTYTWTLPNGWTGTSTTASITVTTSATAGSVSVTSGTACGTSAAQTLAVTPVSIPATPGTITGLAAPCANTSQTYSVAPVTGATTYTWTLPSGWSGTSTTASITVTTSATAGTVLVTANNQCGASAAQTLAVAPVSIPATPVSVSGANAPCSGSSQTYSTAAVAGATSYTWTAPGGWSGTSATNTITYTTSVTGGTVQVRANGTCGNSAFASLAVTPIQTLTPSVIISMPGTPVCQSAKTTFTAIPTNGGTAPSYQWKKNGLNVGTNNATYTDSLLVSGDIVTVVLTSSIPCVTTASATAAGTTVTVFPNVMPGININVAQGLVLCDGAPNTFISNISDGGATPGYQWYLNGNTIAGANGANYTGQNFTNGDVISVVLTSTAACRLADTIRSNKVQLAVYPTAVPTVTVTANPGTSVPASTTITFTAIVTPVVGPVPTYQWYRNSVAVPGEKSSTYTTNMLQGGDLISVQVGALGPCSTPNFLTSSTLRISDPAGIAAAGSVWEGVFSLYPNPNGGHFTVAADWGLAHAGTRVQIVLVNALGQSVYSTGAVAEAGKWRVEVDLNEGVANGLYMLRMTRQSDGSSLARPVLIQR